MHGHSPRTRVVTGRGLRSAAAAVRTGGLANLVASAWVARCGAGQTQAGAGQYGRSPCFQTFSQEGSSKGDTCGAQVCSQHNKKKLCHLQVSVIRSALSARPHCPPAGNRRCERPRGHTPVNGTGGSASPLGGESSRRGVLSPVSTESSRAGPARWPGTWREQAGVTPAP